MNIRQRLAHHHHPANDQRFIEGRVAILQDLLQAAPRHKLHYEVVSAPFLEIENQGRDTRVLHFEQQVNLFIKPLNGRLAFILSRVRVDQQLLNSAKIARSINLLHFVHCSHPTFAEHLHNLKFSIQNRPYWKWLKRHTIVLIAAFALWASSYLLIAQEYA